MMGHSVEELLRTYVHITDRGAADVWTRGRCSGSETALDGRTFFAVVHLTCGKPLVSNLQ